MSQSSRSQLLSTSSSQSQKKNLEENSSSHQEISRQELVILKSGFLTKSPPLEKSIHTLLKAKWRKRFFLLVKSSSPNPDEESSEDLNSEILKEDPIQKSEIQNGGDGQNVFHYFLRYYADESLKKLKGQIPLEFCEQVDIGLNVEKRYDFVFSVRIPQRHFYLAAEDSEDMVSWVDAICGVCGLRSTDDDEEKGQKQQKGFGNAGAASDIADSESDAGFTTYDLGSTASSAITTAVTSRIKTNQPAPALPAEISSPYITLSTCFSGGKPPPFMQQQQQQSSPRSSELDDSVFLSDSSPDSDRRKTTSESSSTAASSSHQLISQLNRPIPLPPSRPPKPPHLTGAPNSNCDNYANTGPSASSSSSRRREQNNNNHFKPGSAATMAHFRRSKDEESHQRKSSNPHQSGGQSGFATVGHHSGFGVRNPPPIERTLKPKNFASDANISRNLPNGNGRNKFGLSLPRGGGPSNISLYREDLRYDLSGLGANIGIINTSSPVATDFDEDNRRFSFHESIPTPPPYHEEEQIYFYMPSLPSVGGENIMIPATENYKPVEYTDLNLPPNDDDDEVDSSSKQTSKNKFESSKFPANPPNFQIPPNSSSSNYKRIDFVKTEAFNKLRQEVEGKRDEA